MPANSVAQRSAQQPYRIPTHTSDTVARHPQEHPGDRRGERRFDVEWFLWAGRLNAPPVRGWVVNVSTSGMLVKLPVAYDQDTLVEFEVWYAARQSIRVLGKIARREYSRHTFLHGVEFIGMTESDRKTLGAELLRMRREELQLSLSGLAAR